MESNDKYRGSVDGADVWSRHVLDSAQLIRLAPSSAKTWVDLGSGGGFPGIVVAILAADLNTDLKVTLVESDRRKCAFLAEATRQLGLEVRVLAKRIESLEPLKADIVSARALAPLSSLCSFASRHIAENGICIFPKGVTFETEIARARLAWRFELESTPSITDERAALLILRGLQSV